MIMPFVRPSAHRGKTIHHTANVSEQVNRKCPPRNTILQLSNPLHWTYLI